MGVLDMKAAIESIVIKERIRKEITRIPELAADIEENGLLHPVTVMRLESGGLQLIAGLRRIRAVQELGWVEIDVCVIAPADAEAVLRIEISENEQREQFTYSEKMDYGRLLEIIEKENAKGRKADGQSLGGTTAGNGRNKQSCLGDARPVSNSDQTRPPKQRVRDIVGEKIGMSGRQYERAKYVADNAPQELIDQIDSGECTVFEAYDGLRAKEKAVAPPPPGIPLMKPPERTPPAQTTFTATEESTDDTNDADDMDNQGDTKARQPKWRSRLPSDYLTEEQRMDRLGMSDKEREAIRQQKEFAAMTPEEKVVELERQLQIERVRAVTAETDLDVLKINYGIAVDDKDSIIEFLKKKNAELMALLDKAYAKIAELEAGAGNTDEGP